MCFLLKELGQFTNYSIACFYRHLEMFAHDTKHSLAGKKKGTAVSSLSQSSSKWVTQRTKVKFSPEGSERI